MIDQILAYVAPHPCSGCALSGTLLCDNCKYDIASEPFSACAACGKGLAGTHGICSRCTVPYQRAWCVADRREALERLIDKYKFYNTRAAHVPLSDLLHAHLPELPENTVIVPIPTVSSHVRQRGYDHMLLVARRLARLRKLPISTTLARATSTKQFGSGRAQRIAQAKLAFRCDRPLDPTRVYLLLDDVITTGSTMRYAARTLQGAGAQSVWIASISRQPMD